MLRSLFRFSIRDVLWLTVVVALLAVLWLERRDNVRTLRAAKQEANDLRLHGELIRDFAKQLKAEVDKLSTSLAPEMPDSP